MPRELTDAETMALGFALSRTLQPAFLPFQAVAQGPCVCLILATSESYTPQQVVDALADAAAEVLTMAGIPFGSEAAPQNGQASYGTGCSPGSN